MTNGYRGGRFRLGDCAAELGVLLKEEKLAGASLLILANKQDLPGALSLEEITQVSLPCFEGVAHWGLLYLYCRISQQLVSFLHTL